MRVGDQAPRELLLRQHRTPRACVLEQLRDVLQRERPDVDAVDRGHRGDVARAEALERAHVEVRVVTGGSADRLVELVGAAQRAGDVRADIHRVPTDGRRLEHVVEGRDRREVGGGEAHHARDLVDRRGRAPAVHALRRGERGQRRGAAVGIVGHVRLDLRAQILRHRGARGVGDLRGILREVRRFIPAGHARAVLVALDRGHRARPRSPCALRVICRSLPGSDRASRWSRSCRRYSCPRPCARGLAG